MNNTIKTLEWDNSKTYSGLPAPKGWTIYERREDGLMWIRLFGAKISVIEDISIKADGKRWLHVSVGNPKNRMPTYEEIQEVRKLFVGEHRECYHIFPTSERYVNFANVLHLFCCLDQPDGVLPHMEGEIAPGILSI